LPQVLGQHVAQVVLIDDQQPVGVVARTGTPSRDGHCGAERGGHVLAVLAGVSM